MSEEESFSARLIEAMADMENPTKSKTANVPTKSGKSYQYKYETLDQVLGVVRPALAEHGLALTQQQAWSANTNSYVLKTIVFDASEERLMDERPLHDAADAQAAGSWETYMRRYALRTAFGLAGEDDDGAATVGRTAPAKRASAAQAKKDPMQDAKAHLWAACKAYAEGHDSTPEKIAEGVKKRPDYEETAEFYERVIDELESAS